MCVASLHYFGIMHCSEISQKKENSRSHGYGVSHFHVFVGVRLLPLSLV